MDRKPDPNFDHRLRPIAGPRSARLGCAAAMTLAAMWTSAYLASNSDNRWFDFIAGVAILMTFVMVGVFLGIDYGR
jgi:uncharacterized membrane protein (DUF4010 family)